MRIKRECVSHHENGKRSTKNVERMNEKKKKINNEKQRILSSRKTQN